MKKDYEVYMFNKWWLGYGRVSHSVTYSIEEKYHKRERWISIAAFRSQTINQLSLLTSCKGFEKQSRGGWLENPWLLDQNEVKLGHLTKYHKSWLLIP